MPAVPEWDVLLRGGVLRALGQRGCRSGWTVSNFRGRARLHITARAGDGRAGCSQPSSLQPSAPPPATPSRSIQIDWAGLISRYQQHKLRSGAIKETTWERLYKPRMALVLKTAKGPPAARDATQLLEAQADLWSQRPGCRTRRLQIQHTAALLRWPVPQHGVDPLLMNLVGPTSPVELRERQAHHQIAEWSGIENAGVVAAPISSQRYPPICRFRN